MSDCLHCDINELVRERIEGQESYLENLKTSRDVAHMAGLIAQTNHSPYSEQAFAYLMARSGEIRTALVSLERLLHSLDSITPWQAEMASGAHLLKSLLESDPKRADEQLRTWEIETMGNLGLNELADCGRQS